MKISLTQMTLVLGLPILACLSTEGWAIRRGEMAYGPAYSAVIAIDSCSAVVIHPRAFLTSAHCAPMIIRGWTTVHFTDRNSGNEVVIKEVYVHEGYVEKISSGHFKANDDFALVVLSEPIRDASVLSSIPKIISESAIAPDQTLTAVGFGVSRGFSLETDENSVRRKAAYRLTQKQLSVDFLKLQVPGVGFCGGDSGGALLRVSADGKSSELVGILTATGGSCGDKDQYDYAESVSSHLDWIKAKLQGEGINF